MQTVGIFFNNSKKNAVDCAAKISNWLTQKGKTVFDISSKTSESKLSTCDLVISVGGDGSIIKVASILNGKSVPILGVNAGNLGFLTSIKENEVFAELEQIFVGKYREEKRLMLTAIIEEEGSAKQHKFDVVNDVVISREGVSRFLNISVSVDGNLLTDFGGDGLIIATPTGSTAYSLSAGGPFIYPILEDILLTPLCPHSLKVRPVVVPADVQIKVKAESKAKDGCAYVIFDGQNKCEISSRNVVTVRKASYSFHIIQCSKRNYFDVVHEKF